MILSANIKQYRKDKGITQEYMAEQLYVSQPTYWRIENNDCTCLKRLSVLAKGLNTTPEVLQNYHLAPNSTGGPKAADWVVTLLDKKEETILQQQEIINFQNHYLAYLRVCWKEPDNTTNMLLEEQARYA